MSYIAIALIFLFLLFITINEHNTSVNRIKNHHNNKIELIEKNVIDSVQNANSAAIIAESFLNNEMEEMTRDLIEKYKKDDSVLEWDMSKINQDVEPYEFYIINENLQVITATLEEDIGLDFTKFKAFSQLLKQRLEGNEFSADRLDISITNKELKKYSYMPTPDNKYLFELSINTDEILPEFQNLNFLQLTEKLENSYDRLNEITIFKFNENAEEIGVVDPDKTSEEGYDFEENNDIKDYIKKTVKNDQTTEQQVKEDGKVITVNKFYPLLYYTSDNNPDWWNSYVMKFTYDNTILNSELKEERHKFFITLALLIAIFSTFTIIITRLFVKTENMAYYDHLTNLPNRKYLDQEFHKLIAGTQEKTDEIYAIFFIDLDEFKKVNDRFGHEVGDKLLIEVGKRMKSHLRKNDIISRLGGDEFIIILNLIQNKEESTKVAEKLIKLMERPFKINGHKINVNVSIGISIYPNDGKKPEELINKADMAMYQAKNRHLNYKFFSD
ncbi:MAG: diguanylate cyclase domain-containing protein [Halanaerobiales bacterium]